MKKTSLRHVLHVFCVSLAYILSTASACDGDSSGSGGGSDEIRNDATYEFEKVNLVYEIPEESGTLTSIYVDLGELSMAHWIDGTKLNGTITDLNNILYFEEDYPEDRKPEIKVTMKLYDNTIVEHKCSKHDIGNNYVQNIPNYGANVINLTVSVKSIKTTLHNMQLCWTKAFDLTNTQWWDPNLDKALSGDAKVTILGYTKYLGDDDQLFVRDKNGTYEIATYIKDYSLINTPDTNLIIELPDTPPIKAMPIYKEGKIADDIEWDSPIAVRVERINDNPEMI